MAAVLKYPAILSASGLDQFVLSFLFFISSTQYRHKLFFAEWINGLNLYY